MRDLSVGGAGASGSSPSRAGVRRAGSPAPEREGCVTSREVGSGAAAAGDSHGHLGGHFDALDVELERRILRQLSHEVRRARGRECVRRRVG